MNGIIIRTLSDQLVELVRNRVLAGTVAPDLPIRQDVLAAELGVSKIPLREAFARLEQEGLLVSRANRGFFVRALTTGEAEEVFALRLKLEPATVAIAATRATPEDQRVAIELLETLDRVTDEHGEGVGAFNRAFHLALIRPSGKVVTTDMLGQLHVFSERYVRKHLEPLGRNERANEEHSRILNAWLAKDTKNVARFMREHITQTLRDLRGQLSTEGGASSID